MQIFTAYAQNVPRVITWMTKENVSNCLRIVCLLTVWEDAQFVKKNIIWMIIINASSYLLIAYKLILQEYVPNVKAITS